jgi:polar amino acid transport system substrate-binding protein
MKRKLFLCLLMCFILTGGIMLSAKEYKVAVNQISTTDYYVNLMKAIAEITGNTFDIQVVPRARAIYLIENKMVDVQIPNSLYIQDPAKLAELKYDFSSLVLMKVCFVLFSNKSKNINVEELKKGNPKKLIIETDTSLIDSFTFTPQGSPNPEGSLRKVDNGSIDGFLYSQSSTDPILKKTGLKNIKRLFYSYYNLTYSLQKGAKGGEVDKIITDGINKLKAKGTYNAIIGDYFNASSVFVEWQP